jgi:hypothetical protein
MERDEMLRLFEAHREAEAARDIDGILKTFVPDPFLDTKALGILSEGRDAVRLPTRCSSSARSPISRLMTRGWRLETRPLSCGARVVEQAVETGSESLQAEARSPCPLPTWCRSMTG